MLTVAKLREVIASLPDDARLVAYEGEGCGLRVLHQGRYGWIETGCDEDKAADDFMHDIEEFSGASSGGAGTP